jgi:hypothetical protein
LAVISRPAGGTAQRTYDEQIWASEPGTSGNIAELLLIIHSGENILPPKTSPESGAHVIQELVDGQRATLPRSICRMSSLAEIGAE